jgi:predicted oxidoreductase
MVSRMVMGLWRLVSWQLTGQELLHLVHTCLDMGMTTFDLADIYGDYTCEELFGRALEREAGLRHRLQLVTKCGVKLVSSQRPGHQLKHYDTSYAHIITSADQSLAMLHTDRLDLLLIHRPDPLMDPDEVARAFHDLWQSGKVLHFGVSNFTPAQFDLLASRLDFPLVTNQVELSVLHMDVLHDGTVDQCLRLGLSPMAWSPLGGGRLFDADGPRAVRVREALAEVGEELGGASLDQAALAWILRHPAHIVPILGSGKIDRLRREAASTNLTLSRQQWFAIWTASAGHAVP